MPKSMTKSTLSLLIAVNQPLTEAGILAFLSGNSDFQILENIHSSENVVEQVLLKKPDLLIIDYNVSGFLSLDDLETIMNTANHPHVLVISADDNKAAILRAVQLGIKGYLTKDCDRNEFLVAVQSTAKGDRFFCSKILDVILNSHHAEDSGNAILTTREKEILKFLAQGHSTQKIADTLHLSPHTVQTHRKSIIRKLKIKSPTQFVIAALDMGLISQK